MKKLTLSLATILATSTLTFAGGDISPVEPIIDTPIVIEEEEIISDSGVYLGVAYSLLRSDSSFIDSIDNNHKLGADYSSIMFQGGYKFNEYIAVEGRYWLGLTDEAFELENQFFSRFESDALAWGIYAKPMYPVTEELDVYALLGYGSAAANGIALKDGSVHDVDVDGFSWGLGVAYSFTENISIFADYVDFQDDTVEIKGSTLNGTFEHAFDAINLGVSYKF
ncbi:MAG TPA: porin family protein [Sulfurovum sp.]|nr:porin family protein [Sulfurovum sp.]